MDKKKITQGVFWGGLSSATSLGLKFMTIPILARLLSPEQFGVVAVALAIMSFIVMAIGKGGLGAAILYYENTDPGQYVHTVFWANFFLGTVLALLCYLNAGWLAEISGVEKAKPYIEVISFSIPLLLLEQVGRSLLLLKMEYKKMAGVTLFASMLGGISALVLAYSGAGAWSLICQQLVYQVLLMTGFLYMTKFIPKLEFKRDRLSEIMPYAMRNTASDILMWCSSQGVILFVGRFFGASTVGGYQVSNRLAQLPREVVGNALDQAVFSGVANSQKGLDKSRTLNHKLEHVWRDFLLVTKINTYFLGSVYLLLAIYAESVVIIVLGESFYEFWPVFRAMTVFGFIGVFLSAVYPFLKGIGEDRLVLKLSLYRAILTLLFVYIVAELDGDIVFVTYTLAIVQLLMLLITVSKLSTKVNSGLSSIIFEFKGVTIGFITLLSLSWPVNEFFSFYFESMVLSSIFSGFIVLLVTILILPLLAKNDWLLMKSWLKVKFE
ncbi:oligosaccharide flippase family protein [uncultured Amphritea sp.]|uniref:oligosaccharide flippase family protein n=1 Tax=uncultured Amphritea sp. TaxID=981605 RepID=UPI002629DF09|nr:oligosaccharide flippase family protein [uncultured Amphritea sp.]